MSNDDQQFVMVPREPNEEMLRAGWNEYLGDSYGGFERFAKTYRAMIAAAPKQDQLTPPATPAEGTESRGTSQPSHEGGAGCVGAGGLPERAALDALEKINEWCCFASEEDASARLMALQQIGVLARDALRQKASEA